MSETRRYGNGERLDSRSHGGPLVNADKTRAAMIERTRSAWRGDQASQPSAPTPAVRADAARPVLNADKARAAMIERTRSAWKGND